jgi:hypothetical protein
VQQLLLHSNQVESGLFKEGRVRATVNYRGKPRLFFMPVKERKVEKPTYAVGARVDKFCAKCQEERGHIVATITKRGQISRVSCPKCGVRSSFKPATGPRSASASASAKASAPYDRTRTYRTGQHLTHATYGPGEVTAVIEPKKIDVLFSDRVCRLIYSQPSA